MSKTNWETLNLEDDDSGIDVEIKTNGDEQVVVSVDDDAEFDDGSEEKDKKVKTADKDESEDDAEEEKPTKRRKRGGRAAERIRALSDKLRQQENHWKTELDKVRQEVHHSSNLQKASETVANIDRQLADSKQKLVKAKENSDYSAEADAIAEIQQLGLDRRIAQSQNIKKTESIETRPPDQVQNQAKPPEAYSDWSADNPWFEEPETGDERKLVRFIRKKAKELTNDDGLSLEDDEFYEELNDAAKEFVNQRKLTVDGFELTETEAKKKQKTSPTQGGKDQSVSRTNEGGIRIHLTKGDKEMADRLNVSYQEYAKQKLRDSKKTTTGWSNVF